MKKVISIVLALVLLITVFAGCSGEKNKDIHTVEVMLPMPSDAEGMANLTATLALDYYMLGRAYLDEFVRYDTTKLTEKDFDEYRSLCTNALEAFENADKVNAVLGEAIDILAKQPVSEEQPTIINNAKVSTLGFGITAYAAPEQGSDEWAAKILEQWSQRTKEYGGLKRISDYLGKDVKYAYSALQQAQSILEGKDWQELAKKENEAYQAASVLKTTGTAAGLVIAVATAPASGTVAAAVSTGGIVVSGANTVLEVGSTGALLYNNGEDNEFTAACDKTEAQLAPIGQVFSVASVGASLKDISTTGSNILKNGYNSLSEKDKTELAMNTFNTLSYGANSLNDYMNSGSIMSGTFTATDEGLKLTLKETLTGTEPEKQNNVKQLLTEAGVDEKVVDGALEKAAQTTTDSAKETEEAEKTATEPSRFQTDEIPSEIAKEIISENTPDDDFDIDAYLQKLREVLYEMAGIDIEQSTEEATSEKTTQAVTESSVLLSSKVAGSYNVKGSVKWTDSEGSESESISGTITVSVIDETTLSFDDGIADYKSSYDPKTGKASGFTDGDGARCSFKFTENNGTVMMTMNYSYSDGYESGKGTVTGTKN